MRFLAQTSNEEMVVVFLRGELDSPRYAEIIETALRNHRSSRALIERPNLNDKAENDLRAAILLGYRPWLVDFGLLKKWPPNSTWHWCELTHEDIENLQYVSYSYWDELSNGTHLVQEGAKNVRAGKIIFGVSNDNFWEIARRIDEGEGIPPMIILSGSNSTPYIVIEGHTRATSYLLANHSPRAVRALIGTTEK